MKRKKIGKREANAIKLAISDLDLARYALQNPDNQRGCDYGVIVVAIDNAMLFIRRAYSLAYRKDKEIPYRVTRK